MNNDKALESWPLTSVEMQVLAWYADHNNSIDIVKAAISIASYSVCW